MPRQSLSNRPFTKTLSSLRKNELIRLSIEFNLPTDSSVVYLRDRLKTYLTHHNETVYRNPRCRGLYPKPRHSNLNKRSSSSTPTMLQSTPVLSYRSPSPTPSFASWNGIEPQPQVSRSPSPPIQPLPQHEPPSPYLLPPPSIPGSVHNSPRKFFIFTFPFLYLFGYETISSFSLSLETMNLCSCHGRHLFPVYVLERHVLLIFVMDDVFLPLFMSWKIFSHSYHGRYFLIYVMKDILDVARYGRQPLLSLLWVLS
jgi:hypothetical protein